MRNLIDSKKRNHTICLVLLSIALAVTTFCFGVVYGQSVTESQTQYIPYIIPKYLDRVEVIEIEKKVEIPLEVIRETLSLELNQFESEEQLAEWYKSQLPNRRVICGWTCVDYALDLQRIALLDGYQMSTQVEFNKKNTKAHMICSTVIGEKIIFIEPQTGETWLGGIKGN